MHVTKVRGMSQGAIDATDAARPYKGGNEALYTLHELDIIDKHHALLPTLFAVRQATIDVNANLREFKAPPFALPNFQEPLKDGIVFFLCEPGVEDCTRIEFDVGLCEPKIIKGKPIVSVLRQLVTTVGDIASTFEFHIQCENPIVLSFGVPSLIHLYNTGTSIPSVGYSLNPSRIGNNLISSGGI